MTGSATDRHGANLLLGVTPDFSGSLPVVHVARYAEFGGWVSPPATLLFWPK
jgi:hypothetical protein